MNPESQKKRVGPILSKEFKNSWCILRQAIENIPDKYWLKSVNDWSFSLTIYHIIETAEFYSRDTPEGMKWGKRAGINLETDSNEMIDRKQANITKELLLVYLGEIEEQIAKYIENFKDDDLYEKDGFDPHLKSILEKLLYLLRHNMHHIGELNKTLRDWDCQRISWR
ncbi:MAG: DinB family protein [Candidatus Hodarchaeota archaeon]